MGSDFHEIHYPSAMGMSAQVDQVIAHFRALLTAVVRSCRGHFDHCDNPGCPGPEAFGALQEVVDRGPGHALATLVLAVHYLAKNEDLLKFEMEEILSGSDLEEGLLGEPGGPGEGGSGQSRGQGPPAGDT